MKRQVAKVVMIIMQFIFYFVVNELFDVPDRIMYNTFFYLSGFKFNQKYVFF